MGTNRKALIVGIQKYETLTSLECCRNDAELICEQLQDYNCQFSCSLLIDEQASAREIRAKFKSLFVGADENAILVFYYAGHGITIDNSTFLVTLDSEDDIEGGVSFNRLMEIVEANRKLNQTCIFLLDCCHAGSLPVEGMTVSIEQIQKTVAGTSGVALIAATEASTEALEDNENKQGVFTDWLFKGLSGSAANSEGSVTISSLYEFIAKGMEEFEAKQKPVLKTTIIGRSPVLATGYEPQAVIQLSKLTEAERQEIEGAIQGTISVVRRNLDNDRSVWMLELYKDSSRILEELLDWMANLGRSHPTLKEDTLQKYDKEILQLQAQLADIQVGTILRDGKVVREIGQGGFGTVYTVESPHGLLAYKVYHGSQLFDRLKIKAFGTGYKAMRRLDHPNVVHVYQDTKAPFGFFMDYVDGANFRDWWIDDLAKLMNVLHIVAQALAHAHSKGVIHRDIKPENIIIDAKNTEFPVPYLTDFDLAWYSMATVFSTKGDAAAFGHYLYAAPEQYENPGTPITRKPTTDIYGFGQLCYFAICGHDPARERSESINALKERIQQHHWPSAETAMNFVNMYSKCIERRPSDRMQSMDEISSILLSVRNDVIDPNKTRNITQDQFLQELIFGIFGFGVEPTNTFYSRSERTQVNIVTLNNNRVEIKFDVSQEFTGVTGTYEQQKNTISRRVDSFISRLSNELGMQIGRQQDRLARTYGVKIDIPGNNLTLAGVAHCRQVILGVIDSLEPS